MPTPIITMVTIKVGGKYARKGSSTTPIAHDAVPTRTKNLLGNGRCSLTRPYPNATDLDPSPATAAAIAPPTAPYSGTSNTSRGILTSDTRRARMTARYSSYTNSTLSATLIIDSPNSPIVKMAVQATIVVDVWGLYTASPPRCP